MFKIEYAKNPEWTNSKKQQINLVVKFVEIDQEVSFTADPNDSVEHGRVLFQQALSKAYGEIAEPDLILELEKEKVLVRLKRNQLLAASDWTQSPDIPQATRESYTAYRQALRDVPQQEGFPQQVIWPDLPQG